MPSTTTILHVDMDAFYASIEMRDDSRLAGRPVCVGGSVDSRGVIASASYEARRFGVRSAMPTGRALALCRELVVVPPNFEKYGRESRAIMEIFRRYTPLVEPLSLDEAFLDVAGCEPAVGTPLEIAHAIRRDILRETGLVASVGLAASKFLAKLASDLSKPDGLKVIEPHEARAVLDPLPVSVIFGVGPRTAKRLEALGVRTVRDLADLARDEVLARFGASGAWIHDLAHGEDPRRVSPRREEKSFSQERTFARDVDDRAELRRRLHEFCEELGYRLRSHGLRARTVAVKARFADFKTVTRTATLEVSTHLGVRLYAAARELFERVPAAPLRLLGVQVSGFDDLRTPRQADLFPAGDLGSERGPKKDRDERLERLNAGLDRLRAKHGAPPAIPASLLERPAPSPSARV